MNRTAWYALLALLACAGCKKDEGIVTGVFQPLTPGPCAKENETETQSMGTLLVTNQTNKKRDIELEARGRFEFTGKGATFRDTLAKGESKSYPVSGECGKEQEARGSFLIKSPVSVVEVLNISVPCDVPPLPPPPISVKLPDSRVGGPPAEGSLDLPVGPCGLKFAIEDPAEWLKVTPMSATAPPGKPFKLRVTGTCIKNSGAKPGDRFNQIGRFTIRGFPSKPATVEVKTNQVCIQPDIETSVDLDPFCGRDTGILTIRNLRKTTVEYAAVGNGVQVIENATGEIPSEGDPAKVTFSAQCEGRGPFRASITVGIKPGDEQFVVPIETRCNCPTGSSDGDPHLVTIDGLKYDFQAVGEFALADSGDLLVHIRQRPFRDGKTIAGNGAVAARVAGRRVAIYADQKPQLRVDGKPEELAAGPLELAKGAVVRASGGTYVITWPEGDRLTVISAGDHLNLRLAPASGRRGKVRGLLGNYDGDPTNDLAGADGKAQPLPLSFRDLYGAFADAWRIKQTESLFDYGPGETTETFTDRAFPAAPATTSTLPADTYEKARKACANAGVTDATMLDACILDVGLTGDESLAAALAAVGTPEAAVGGAYWSDFEQAPGAEWKPATVGTTPGGKRPATKFLGPFGNDKATLTLGRLGAHDKLRVSLDLYVILSWDGNAGSFGPDVWELSVDGVPVLHTTFANWLGPPPPTQAYPDAHPGGDHPGGHGALEKDALGYLWAGKPMDTVYRLSFEVPHAAEEATIVFSATGLQEITDESWGIDDLSVTPLASPMPPLYDLESCTQGLGRACSNLIWDEAQRGFVVTNKDKTTYVIRVMKWDGTNLGLVSLGKNGRHTYYEGTKNAAGFEGTVKWPPGTYGPREGKWTAKRIRD